MGIEFTKAEVEAIAKWVLETECGYCNDGADLDTAICPECGADNLYPEGQRPA